MPTELLGSMDGMEPGWEPLQYSNDAVDIID